jgi:hypothetical protein
MKRKLEREVSGESDVLNIEYCFKELDLSAFPQQPPYLVEPSVATDD